MTLWKLIWQYEELDKYCLTVKSYVLFNNYDDSFFFIVTHKLFCGTYLPIKKKNLTNLLFTDSNRYN